MVNTDQNTFLLNLFDGSLFIGKNREKYDVKRDYTYRKMHSETLKDKHGIACSSLEAEAVLKLIAAVEKSSDDNAWVRI